MVRASDPRDPALLALCRAGLDRARALRADASSRIAVVSDDGSDADRLVSDLAIAGEHIDLLRVDDESHDRHPVLAARGPFDLIVDLTGRPDRLRRALDLVYHLDAGGALVVRGAAPGGEVAGKLGRHLRRAVASRGRSAPPQGLHADVRPIFEHALGDVLAAQDIQGDHVALVSRGTPCLAKLDEAQFRSYRSLRPGVADVVTHLPATTFGSLGVLRTGWGAVDTLAGTIQAPQIDLRDYRDVVVAPGQVVATHRLLLPDSYRHHLSPRLRNRNVLEVAPRFGRLPFDPGDAPVLEGAFLHLDNELRGHFGHALTEQVSRLWSWPVARRLVPGLKVLLTESRGLELCDWELELLRAAGIEPDDIEFVRRPVRVERLLSGTPMLSNPHYVHPGIRDVWRTVGDALAGRAPRATRPDRIFCSRRLAKRACHNTEEVERIFAAHGFSVIHPEDHPLPEQVALFRAASTIAGFAGSGLFHIALVPDPKRVITVGSESYTARNEYLIASVLGHEIDAVTCRPDEPTFQSPFTFDHAREGVRLAALLDSLG